LNTTIELLQTRVSCGKLAAPAPNELELEQILRCGLRAPDHGRLKPWRFHVVQDLARNKLGEVFASVARAQQECAQSKIDKCLNMSMRAPLIIVVVCEPQLDTKIPVSDQQLAVGAAVQNMQVAISALGYSSIWRTGDMAHAPIVKQAFNVSEHGSIAALLYIGTPQVELKIPDIDLQPYVKNWI
jgi:nitroreductase